MTDRTAAGGDPLGLVLQLVALAADQTETRGLVNGLLAGVEQLGAEAARLAEATGATEAQLDEVQVALAAVTDAVSKLGTEPDSTPMWVWTEMDPESQRGALRELAGWVDEVLVGRYHTGQEQLPRCWYRHPAAVEELSWLYLDWVKVYRGGKGSSTSAAGEWHDRWRPGVMDRLGRALSNCRTEHRDWLVAMPPGTDVGFEEYLATIGQEPPPPPAAPAGWGPPAPGAAPPPTQQGWYPHQT